MNSLLRRTFLSFLFALIAVFCLLPVVAQTNVSAPKNAVLRGHITDPSGALIPGAKITITNALGVEQTSVLSDTQGSYIFTSLPAGGYIVRAEAEGFASFASHTLELASGQSKRVDIAMAVEVEQQSVVVTEDAGPTVSVDAGSNVSTIVLKGKDLDALSDDPDELQNELTALAGPSAGPNGGQLYIDGFTGGTLPPKSAIREIRINQNPFSAEFDRIGYGRIEILTKPGTDKLHARGFVQGNDKSFNTGNPFTSTIPEYHSIQYNGTVSGALSKNSSFFLSIEGRNNQDASIYTAYVPVRDSVTGLYSVPTQPTTGGLFNPSSRLEISPRFDIQLGQKNTLTTRFQYERSSSRGSIGSTSLPTQSSSSNASEYTFQFSDAQIINDHVVNETRGQFRRALSSTTPVSTDPTISVSGYLGAGGSSSQSSNTHSDHIELQNITTISAGAHAIKFGGWLRDNRTASFSNSNFNGSFQFQNLTSYVSTLNGTLQVYKLTYTAGLKKFEANVFDAAAFFQDDWKVNRFLTLSGGLRFESQNHAHDHIDFAPRLAFAYALDGHKKGGQTKTVVRGGYGFFYDRLGVSSLLTIAQNNGGTHSQSQTVISNPQCFYASGLPSDLSACGSGTAATKQIQSLSTDYRSPYNEQLGISLERQLSKVATLSGTYIHTFGVHQIATRNSNAYQPQAGTTYYNSTTGSRPNGPNIVDEIYPEAVFKQNQLIVNTNAKLSPNFSLMGFYSLSYANGNTGTASNSWDLDADYGPASFVRRNMVFVMGNYSGPWGLSFNPFLIAHSGKRFDIVTNTDLTGDNFNNNRPAIAADATSCSTSTGRYITTAYGCLDMQPQANSKILPTNLGQGPSSVAVNLRISRAIGLGPKIDGPAGASNGGPQRSYMNTPGGGRGGHGGGPGGGHHGPMVSTGHKYSLNFSVQALNLFNNIDYGTPSGTIVPTLVQVTNQVTGEGIYGPGKRFGNSTNLAGGIFSTSSAARRIFFQTSFSF